MTAEGSTGDRQATAPLPLSIEQLADGRYELGETLGSGGMGLVRKAHDHRLGRSVAIKLLADNLAADPIARERFLREARAAAAIANPNVVAVYDVGDEAGRPYLVMELVDGPSLAAVIRDQGPLPVSRVTEIAADALEGLEATHLAGIVHRDVKPGNLLTTPSGQVKLTDLGVAEAADAPGLTRTGMVVGTRTYLAPERCAGGVADASTDLYALGVTFVELLFGPAPDDPKGQIEQAHWLPRRLRTLLLQLIADDPADRPTSAAAAGELLDTGTSCASAAGAAADDPAPTRTATSTPDADTVPASRPNADTRPTSLRWWVIGVATFIALGLLVAALRGDPAGDANGPPTPVETPAAEVDEVPPVPRGDDPATTARNLAEWLRER